MPRGAISHTVIAGLADRDPGDPLLDDVAAHADPFGGDLQLALYVCYELHYRGFDGVDPAWEWDPGLLALRAVLERRFLAALRAGAATTGTPVSAMDELASATPDPAGLSAYLRDSADWDQMREFLVHRSLYHLKEADPHAWVIPRLHGRAKAALVAVEFDEFGGGRAERIHAVLFENLLAAADLDSGYLAYLDSVPPEALATVNFMTLCGLHRRWRGALVGLFAAAEITSSPSSRAIAAGLRRLGAPEECTHFYDEHVEADAVHEQVLRHDVVGDLIEREPALARDVVFGIAASELLEARLRDRLLGSWERGESSLLAGRQLTV